VSGYVDSRDVEHCVEVKHDDGSDLPAVSWAGINRGGQPPHLAKIRRGGFVIVRVAEPTGASHPSGSRHVLLHEERLALVVQCLEVEVQLGELATWVLKVAFCNYAGSDGLPSCTVWRQLDEEAVYVPLTQIHRSTHCVHLCGNGCSSEFLPGEMVTGDRAVGLIGEHDLIRNPFYLLNEHFLRKFTSSKNIDLYKPRLLAYFQRSVISLFIVANERVQRTSTQAVSSRNGS
jgi:hypothetical protein